MRPVAVILFALAVVCALFAVWGLFTPGGARRFDEMGGLIPFFAGCASIPLLIASAVTWWLRRRAK